MVILAHVLHYCNVKCLLILILMYVQLCIIPSLHLFMISRKEARFLITNDYIH